MELFIIVAVLAFGYSCSYRVLAVPDPFFRGCFSLPIGTLSLLCLVNGLLRVGASLNSALWASGLLIMLAAALLCRTPKGESLPRVSRTHVWTVGAVALLVFLHTNLARNQSGDDDYWIHTPLQALLSRGVVPISHPYFSDIPMNGHYGRNLLIAILVKLSGCGVFATEAWHIGVIQATTAALLWWTVYMLSLRKFDSVEGENEGRCAAMAYGAVLWVFLGINVGGRLGLLDTYQNNNGQVYLEVVLISYLLYRVWEDGRPALIGLAALLLGGFAIVYETHFGLLALGILSLSALYFRQERKAFLNVFLTLVMASGVAATQGGPFSSLAQRLFSPAHREYSVGEMNQHQVVTIKFPKAKLFQIQLGLGNYQRVSSAAYVLPTPAYWKVLTPGTPYASIWSFDVLKIHWLVTWLAPVSLIFALRDKNRFLCLYWIMGTISYLVPAVVDFGPVYEFEYFRWEFAAGLFYAVVFGSMMGSFIFTAISRPPLYRGALSLGWTLVALVCFIPGYQLHIKDTLRSFTPRRLLPLNSQSWLKEHAQALRISDVDIRFALLIRKLSQSHDRMLTNFREDDLSAILAESTFVGLSGVQSVGHALPLEEEPVGTPPFRMSPAARAFWHSFDPAVLEQLRVDWLYVHPGPEIRADTVERLNQLPFLKQVYADDDHYRLYQVVKPLSFAVQTAPLSLEGLSIDFGPLDKPLPPKVCFAGSFRGSASKPTGRFRYHFVSEEKYPGSELDWVCFSLCSDGEIPIVTPQHEGRYHLELAVGNSDTCVWKSPSLVVKKLRSEHQK